MGSGLARGAEGTDALFPFSLGQRQVNAMEISF